MDKISSKYTPGEAQSIIEDQIDKAKTVLLGNVKTFLERLRGDDMIWRVAAARLVAEWYEELEVSENAVYCEKNDGGTYFD